MRRKRLVDGQAVVPDQEDFDVGVGGEVLNGRAVRRLRDYQDRYLEGNRVLTFGPELNGQLLDQEGERQESYAQPRPYSLPLQCEYPATLSWTRVKVSHLSLGAIG